MATSYRILRITLLVAVFLAISAQSRAEDGAAPGHIPLPQRGEKGSPKDVIPVPVIPDKMAVPAPTVQDRVKKPGEPPEVQPSDHPDIPEPERRSVTPADPQRSR